MIDGKLNNGFSPNRTFRERNIHDRCRFSHFTIKQLQQTQNFKSFNTSFPALVKNWRSFAHCD